MPQGDSILDLTALSVIASNDGPSKLFQTHAKHFQICGLFLQIFPKTPLAVLWKIKGLQGEKGNFVTPKAPLRSKALDEVGGVCGEGLQDIVSLLAGS
ncbi:MAG: hypothetical protein ABSA66_17225 [Roseiarcus sp.]|jgi:hypothetical protein